MNFLNLEMVEIFEVGDVLNLGGSELIVAELRQGMAKIVPNTLYNRMLYRWPKQAGRGVKGAFGFVRAFCREYFIGEQCYVCHRYPPSQAGLCDICYEIKFEVEAEMASYGMDE